MSVAEKRKSKSSSQPRDREDNNASSSRISGRKAHESSADDTDRTDDEEQDAAAASDRDHEPRSKRPARRSPSKPSSSRSRARPAADDDDDDAAAPVMSTKNALDFIQVLVFAVVMMQAMTLFVSYHMLLATQHEATVNAAIQGTIGSMQGGIARIEHAMAAIPTTATATVSAATPASAREWGVALKPLEARLEALSAQIESLSSKVASIPRSSPSAVSASGKDAAAAPAATELETPDPEIVKLGLDVDSDPPASFSEDADAGADDSALPRSHVEALYMDAHRVINHAKLERLILRLHQNSSAAAAEEDSEDNALLSPITGENKPQGNAHMILTPADLAMLHRYRNWTLTPLQAGSKPVPRDGGPTFNQTHAIMLAVGQAGEGVTSDIAIEEPHRDDRTVVAARDIVAGEYFFRVAQPLLLTSIVVANSPLGRHLAAVEFERDDMVWMAAFVLFEKVHRGPQSRWAAWIATLPNDYSFMPITYDARDDIQGLGLMAGTLAAEWAKEYQLLFRQEYVGLSHALADFKPAKVSFPSGSGAAPAVERFTDFSFAQYVWARLVLLSRAFGVDIQTLRRDPETHQPVPAGGLYSADGTPIPQTASGLLLDPLHLTVMAPLDLANHQSEGRKVDSIWGWNEATKEFAFKATRGIQKGSTIHTTYGPRGNTDLLVHYGFTLPSNPFDFAGLCVFPVMEDLPPASAPDTAAEPTTGSSNPNAIIRENVLMRTFRSSGAPEKEAGWSLPGCARTWAAALAESSDPSVQSLAQQVVPSMSYRCRMKLNLLEESSGECFAFMRVATPFPANSTAASAGIELAAVPSASSSSSASAVAADPNSDLSLFREKILPTFTADELARQAWEAQMMDGTALIVDPPQPKTAALEPVEFEHEVVVIQRMSAQRCTACSSKSLWRSERTCSLRLCSCVVVLCRGALASLSLAQMAGGPSSNDSSLLRAHDLASAAGQCDLSKPSVWFGVGTAGKCLNSNQLGMLRVRFGEKRALEALVDLAQLVTMFSRDRPRSVKAAYAWLVKHVAPSAADLKQYAATDASPGPLWSRFIFFNEALLPIYFIQAAMEPSVARLWSAEVDADEVERMQEQHRAMYRVELTPENKAADETAHSFGYES